MNMSNINKDYKLLLNVETDELIGDDLIFTDTDRFTSNIYVTVTPNLGDIILQMRIRTNTDEKVILEGQLVGQMVYEFNLPTDFIKLPGNHKMELQVIKGNYIRTSDPVNIKINRSITTR